MTEISTHVHLCILFYNIYFVRKKKKITVVRNTYKFTISRTLCTVYNIVTSSAEIISILTHLELYTMHCVHKRVSLNKSSAIQIKPV